MVSTFRALSLLGGQSLLLTLTLFAASASGSAAAVSNKNFIDLKSSYSNYYNNPTPNFANVTGFTYRFLFDGFYAISALCYLPSRIIGLVNGIAFFLSGYPNHSLSSLIEFCSQIGKGLFFHYLNLSRGYNSVRAYAYEEHFKNNLRSNDLKDFKNNLRSNDLEDFSLITFFFKLVKGNYIYLIILLISVVIFKVLYHILLNFLMELKAGLRNYMDNSEYYTPLTYIAHDRLNMLFCVLSKYHFLNEGFLEIFNCLCHWAILNTNYNGPSKWILYLHILDRPLSYSMNEDLLKYLHNPSREANQVLLNIYKAKTYICDLYEPLSTFNLLNSPINPFYYIFGLLRDNVFEEANRLLSFLLTCVIALHSFSIALLAFVYAVKVFIPAIFLEFIPAIFLEFYEYLKVLKDNISLDKNKDSSKSKIKHNANKSYDLFHSFKHKINFTFIVSAGSLALFYCVPHLIIATSLYILGKVNSNFT